MGKRFTLKAGERRQVLRILSSSMSGPVRFLAENHDGSPTGGKVEVAMRRWFTWHRSEHALAPRNVYEKGFWDSDYRIHVTPDKDCTITFETRHFRIETMIWVLGAVLALGVLAPLIVRMIAGSGQ